MELAKKHILELIDCIRQSRSIEHHGLIRNPIGDIHSRDENNI